MERTFANRRAFTVATLVGGALMLPQSSNAQTAGKTLSERQLSAFSGDGQDSSYHRKLAAHYRPAAAKHEAEIQEHVQLAAK